MSSDARVSSGAGRAGRWAGQALAYALFMGVVGYFATSPPYTHTAPDQAVLKLTISHPGQSREACRERSAGELAALPPNMRATMDCPRERSPVTVSLRLDGEELFNAALPPSGLHSDGPATLYRRIVVPAGSHELLMRLNDSVREPDDWHEARRQLELKPGQILVVDFDSPSREFLIY